MGSGPSEYYMGDQLRCCKCDTVLPPCISYSDYYKDTIHGRFVYVFNGGEYYRPVGIDNAYECESCFNKPIWDQEVMRREEERRKEEERRQEEKRQREQTRRTEEERMRQEEIRKEERRHIMEARRKEARQAEEARRREEERMREEASRKEEKRQRMEARKKEARQAEEARRSEEERMREKRQKIEARRREEERQRMEEKRTEEERMRQEARKKEERRQRVEARRREEERQRMEAQRIEEERMREDERRKQEKRQRMEARRREEERQRMEALRIEQERQRMEAWRIEKERQRMEAQRIEEERMREEERRKQEKRQRMEARRREEERQRMEALRIEQERQRMEAWRIEKERQRIEEERMREEERRKQEKRQRMEARRKEEERQRMEALRIEQERQRMEAWRIEEERQRIESQKIVEERMREEAKRNEEKRQRMEARRREEYRQRMEMERQREEALREEEKLREEARRKQEERQREVARRREEMQREEMKSEEESRRREQQRQKEEARRREEEKLREDARRREDERLREEARRKHDVRQREVTKKKEEEREKNEARRREEQQKIKEEQQRTREAEEKKRQEELNQRLKKSHQQAKKWYEEQLSRDISEEQESKRQVLKSHLNEFEINDESGRDSDELLEILSSKCSIPVSKLVHLTFDQLGKILLALDELLFDEWVSAPPSLSTLQHTQVFITELCALSLETSEEVSLQSISYQVQSLVESISQTACNISESFLLAQALYLNLMHFINDFGICDTDAVLIAERWTEEDLSSEDLILIEFLGTLMVSLQNVVGSSSVFILKMEVQCFQLLLDILTHLNGKENHTESTKMLLRLVESNQWTPVEAVTLLTALSEKYVEEASIAEVLTLVQIYDISPEWTDDSGHSLTKALDIVGLEKFQMDFQKTLRKQEVSSLDSALADLKTLRNLDDSVVNMIRNITSGVLQYSENTPQKQPFIRDSFTCADLNTDTIQNALYMLCKAVSDTKGWWPTVQHMLRWCVLVLTEKSQTPKMVGVEEDPCVIAMFAATQVWKGNKLDIVLSSDTYSHEQTEEWSDFYKHLNISLNTNMKKHNTSQTDVYKADIVYGTMDDFVSDYIQYGLDVMETGKSDLNRGFIIFERSVSDFHHLELSRLKENDALMFAREALQHLMGNFQNEDMELRHRFFKALFHVLYTNLNKCKYTDKKITTILQKCTGEELPLDKIYVLAFLESFLRVFVGETGGKKSRGSLVSKLLLEILFDCAVQFHTPKEQAKELFQLVSNLVAQNIWTPIEALSILVELTNNHHNEDCSSIMKILHLIETYQVSSEWTDEKKQSLHKLINSSKTEKLIQNLEKTFREEKEKSIEFLFDELRQMKNNEEPTLEKSYRIVKNVTYMIKSGEIKKHTDVQQAKKLSHSTDTEDLQKILAVICNAVHQCNFEGKWWPRATQMISWCLLALSDTGKLLEMGTGEGKSCVIAMFAVLRALRGEKVDVLSSSCVLCQRDAQEWTKFYSWFGITVDTNTDKTEDKDRKECYQKDVVYGTIEAFAADHLRQIFEMKDVRPDRSYQCIIIDEVDSLLLDQGVQLTYLSSPMVSMQHLNVILAMIWDHVSKYGFLSTGHQTFIQGPPASFFKAIFDSIDTEGTEINDPMDILLLAEETNIVSKGFTEEIFKSEKDEFLKKLGTVSQDAIVNFLQDMEHYVPCGFTVYTLDDKGLLHLRKLNPYNNQDIPDLTFLVLDEGLCCALYDSEEILIKPIAELISKKVQYTPCMNVKDKISIPGFLKNLIEKKVPVWVQNAFLAMRLREGREYVVENDCICPVDFRSTGIVELNKKWGDGLQQFVEIKHKVKLSTISTVTNYISNLCFFEQYKGKIYGTTGTLGSETEMLFLHDLYPNLSACKMPTFNRRKLFEVKGTLKTSAEEWKSEIKQVLQAEITPNSYRGGRAALVICETINTAKDIHEELKSIIPGEIILYCRSDKDSLSKIDKELLPGDVIVATNLAGRGTDIKVSKQVNNNGGLFVILSFLSENTRVELQAFGRTARKGKPGSAQIIMTTDHLPEAFRTVCSLEEAKKTRDRLAAEKITDMMNDITEMKLREDLFSEYCKVIQDIYTNTDGDEKLAVIAILNEFWGIWLQTKSDEIEQLKRTELQNCLTADLSLAKCQSQSQTSPCSSIYHYIKFGNVALDKKQWDVSTRLFEKAMKQDESWAAIAFYSHAYCTIKQQREDYITSALDDLQKAQESLKYLVEESMVCLQLVKMSSVVSTNSNQTSLEKQLTTKCNMLGCFDKNISEAVKKLEDIQERGRDAIANKSPMFSLVSSADEDLQVEAYNLYSRGLKYVFSVEEEPRFPWEALLGFILGVLQIIGGTLLTVFTFGTLAQVGMGLITEGISDCIYSTESMVTGHFSWQSWAIEKAVSIGISLAGFGVGKLLAKGFKGSKLAIKEFGKELKSMPKFLSKQAKDGLSVVTKTNMNDALKLTAKRVVNETITYGLGKIEEELLRKMLDKIKNKVKQKTIGSVKCNIAKKPLAGLVDSFILSHLQDQQQLSDLLLDKDKKSKLLNSFRKLSNSALHPLYADLNWQNKVNSSIFKVIERAKSEVKGTKLGILTAIQAIHMSALGAEAITSVCSISNKFFSNFQEELDKLKKENGFSEKVKQNELSASQTEMLKEFKQDLADSIGDLLADALVEVFHQKFSSHIVSHVQSKVNGVISNYVKKGLKSERTEEKLRAGQNNRYIACMPVDLNKQNPAGLSGIYSQSHAEKIKNPTTPGTILDIRVLSEETGTKVVILTKNSKGKLSKMLEINPGTKPVGETVTLIYRPKSAQYPEGHYDVCIQNQKISVTSENRSCLFHAFAQGLKPRSSEKEIAVEAARLRTVAADTLLKHPGQWEPFIKRKELTESIRGGHWYMLEGAAPAHRKKNIRQMLKKEVGQVGLYKNWQKYAIKNPGIGPIINADHQPPVKSILEARTLNQNSRLVKAMLEVATNTSPLDTKLIPNVENNHGRELPIVCVPKEIHREFPSSTSRAFRTNLATAISNDDVVATFKLTILGGMPRFRLNNDKHFKDFQNPPESRTRLHAFENSFQQHSIKMVETWSTLLQGKGVMDSSHVDTLNDWINNKGYMNQNDPYRNQVSRLI